MKTKIRVYLDTSVISALFDERNPERKSLTETFFKEIESFEAYISEITVIEVERTPDLALQNKMREKISQFLRLPLTDDVVNTLNRLRHIEIMTPAELL
ncbi:MAG TPA: PIN domain-containing protein [Candidatus Brocadiales bacterium]|nr:PIN domain-containing protein [Candidatus Brocadiales bacterium]